MNTVTLYVMPTMIIGLGATFTFDLWVLFLKRAFKISPSNFCLVGRWLRYMPNGVFRHSNIGVVQKISAECAVGWIAHYMTGVTFAMIFIAFAGRGWLQHPTLTHAILFGVITVLAPFCIMQPALGLGFAASKTANPMQARLRSLMNHTAFGVGLYLFGVLVSVVM